MTQLAIDISPVAPLQSAPVITPLFVCPVRDRCLLNILAKDAGYRCGFELARTVDACPKKERMER